MIGNTCYGVGGGLGLVGVGKEIRSIRGRVYEPSHRAKSELCI